MSRRRSAAGAILLALVALNGCTTQHADHVTVAEFVQNIRPEAHRGDPAVPGLPTGGVLLLATVTEVRTAPALLVELSDPRQEEHIWVAGFAAAPARGEEIWIAITGPPTPHDLVVTTYASTGPLSAPPSRTRVTPRGALALLVGGVAVLALLICGVAALSTARARSRRCPGCAGPVNPRWLTCPRCGHSLVSPPPAPAEMITA